MKRTIKIERLESRSLLTTFVVQAGQSIQDILDVAADNPGPDTVEVPPGVYHESVVISEANSLTLRGTGSKPSDVVLVGDGHRHVIESTSGSIDFGVVIENLRVRKGNSGIFSKTGLVLNNIESIQNAEHGVDAHGAIIRVNGGRFTHNGQAGLSAQLHFSASVDAVYAERNGAEGIRIASGPEYSATVTNSISKHNSGDGFHIWGSNGASIADSSAIDNGANGVTLGGFSVVAEDLKAIANEQDGVLLSGRAFHSTFNNLVCLRNGDDGLDIPFGSYDGQSIRGGRFERNGDNGIEVGQAFASYGLGLEVFDIRAKGNGNNGLKVSAGAGVRVVGGNYWDNGADGLHLENIGYGQDFYLGDVAVLLDHVRGHHNGDDGLEAINAVDVVFADNSSDGFFRNGDHDILIH